MLIASIALHAQSGDSRGRDFWVTFITNNGDAAGGLPGGQTATSQLRLFMSCPLPTTARITLTRTGQTIAVPLPTPDSTVEVNLNEKFGSGIELIPLRRSSLNSEERSYRSFHVEADGPITLQGSNSQARTADAFLALPTPALGRSYCVLAYTVTPVSVPTSATSSEFAVVASEDQTMLTITTKLPLQSQPEGLNPYYVSLSKGEVYFAQTFTTQKGPQDVTGTMITSDKPVAVFGGVERGSIPDTLQNYRDHLCEELPPIESWGKGAIVTPHFPINPGAKYTARVRVLASADSTTWRIDGVPQPPITTHGEFAEIALTRAMRIEADRPILVAQYECSAEGASTGPDIGLGDPFMMVVPPPEQFDTAYAFRSIDDGEFTVHYVNIVTPSNAVASLRLDGTPVPDSVFREVAGTIYSWGEVKVLPGAHHIASDSAFGLLVYGYGPATSYGFPGGMHQRNSTAAVDERAAGHGPFIHASLHPPIPNPVTGATCSVTIELATDARVTLDLADARGEIVRPIMHEARLHAGRETIEVDVTGLSAGIYFCRMMTAGTTRIAKVAIP